MSPRLARIPALLLLTLGLEGGCLAADPGRLFYTPAQRAQLEAARANPVTATAKTAPGVAQRFDGLVIRSDGASTSWVNGRALPDAAGVAGLKPGQIRADGRVYEPYQVLRHGGPDQR